MNLDRWEDDMEREHPRVYLALMVGLLLALMCIGVIYAAVQGWH